jgi:hypothetical protein
MLALFRFLAGVFLLIAVLAAVYDGTRSMAADRLVTTSLLEHWATIAPTSFAGAQGSMRRLHPLLWDGGVSKLLLMPAVAFFGLAGVGFAYAGRRRRGVNVFVN